MTTTSPLVVPSPEQAAILAADLAPLRISAGAGTGKTTTVAMLVADLVARRGLAPEEVLGLTFTNKAAAELADRIRTMVAPTAGPGREAEVHTYHGFASQIVAEFGALVGIERGASVITPTFSRQLLFEVVRHRRFEHMNVTWAGSVERIQRLGAALGDHLVSAGEVAASATSDEPWPERLELLAAWTDYQAEKRRLGVVDYADLISAACHLLDLPEVVGRLRSRYSAVLLDEYQDTNPAQRIMLQRLFGDGYPVVAVGDPDQTIYEWRGATPTNFERFGDHFPKVDGSPADERALTVNRRSDHRILGVANEIRRQAGTYANPLVPVPDAGEGEVSVRWAADALVEADWIADELVRLHEHGVPWSEMAVLFRKNRHIAQVHDTLSNRDIPVEVANLGGLLSVPEVADVRAWMRIVDAPEDGPALLRILMGGRFGLGMGDLVHLTRWVATQDRASSEEVEADHEQVPGHTLIEALDHLEALPSLDGRARSALERFRFEYRHLLEYAQSSSLAELARTILDVTGVWHDVEALSEAGRLSSRLNLYRFLDLTEEWSPLEGRPSLGAFLEHLRAMEENPADELDAARLSGEEAVALLTVHRAKGLEWDVVFVPCVTDGNFPSRASAFPNPYTGPQWLPHEWRLDDPPALDPTMTADEAKGVLREHHLRQEWRTAYVAATRARRRLYFSGAYWYGAPAPTQRPSRPSDLFELVAGLDGVRHIGTDPQPERPEILRPVDGVPAPDPIFEQGWAAALRQALADPAAVTTRAVSLGLETQVAELITEYQQRLFDLTTVPTTDRPFAQASVTGLVNYAACPRRHYWTEVDRLPRRPSPAARRGVQIHRQIELHSLGQVPLTMIEADDLDTVDLDVTPTEEAAAASTSPFDAYLDSSYSNRRPLLVEVPFQFDTRAGLAVRGRIDAVYPDDEGWEIVDFKSGRRRHEPWLGVQLEAYAVAADRVDFGPERPDHLAVTFVYLGGGLDIARHDVDRAWADRAEEHVESIAAAIMGEEFDPVPSAACLTCEFVRFCPAGAAWLGNNGP